MFREIIIPTNTTKTITLPKEFIGKKVEILAFTIDKKERNKAKTKDAFKFWEYHSIETAHFKFDRKR